MAGGPDHKTLQTWDAPLAGSFAVAPDVASLVRIPVPGTVLPNLPKGLVLTVEPPAGFAEVTVFAPVPEVAVPPQ